MDFWIILPWGAYFFEKNAFQEEAHVKLPFHFLHVTIWYLSSHVTTVLPIQILSDLNLYSFCRGSIFLHASSFNFVA